MPPNALTIRAIAPDDEAAWRTLWAGYLAFYETNLDDAITRQTWQRLLDPTSALVGRIAEVHGAPHGPYAVGFSVSVLHDGTWTPSKVCYLEDLFVDPAARGQGVGRALIEDLIALARSQGWSQLYWQTKATNARARALYDTFAAADGYVRYRLHLG